MPTPPPPQPCTACPACDLLLASPPLPPGRTLFCPRCGKKIHRSKHNSVEKVLALSLTGLLLFVPGNFLPLLTMGILGLEKHTSIFGSVLALYDQGFHIVGSVVLVTAMLFPLCTLTLLCAVSSGIALKRPYPSLALLFRLYHHLTEWAMMDVYLIGIFVAIIKLTGMAEVSYGTGLFCFIAMVLSAIAAQSCIDHHLFWQNLDHLHREPQHCPQEPAGLSAREAGLVQCRTCMLLTAASGRDAELCPRCGTGLHPRKKHSINRTWALVCTAIILTLPANILPIMEVEYFGLPDRSTILDGIIYFFHHGSYGIGLIILTASILVPLFKITGILLILISIRFRLTSWLRHKAIMFRFIEFIGRWSMLDIFVIALLCALVQFGLLSTIKVAPAAFYFSGVVLSTMFAAITFDSRLLWDADTTSSCKD